MNNKTTSLEISILTCYIIRSIFIINGVNIILSISERDSIISVIIGFILGIMSLYIYLHINDILPNNNIFSKINYIFSKSISIVFKILLIITTFIYVSYIFTNTISFINYSLLPNINTIYIKLLLLICIYYLISKDLKTLIKTSIIIIFIIIILEVITSLFLISYIKPLNILPLLATNKSNIYLSSLYYMIISAYPIFLLLLIPKSNIGNSKSLKRYIKLSYIITNIYNLFNIILLLSIIDIKLLNLLKYPQIFILSKISILNIFDRLENILSFKYLFDSFIFISLGIFYIKKGLFDIFKKKKYINFIILLVVLLLSMYLNNFYIMILSLTIFFLIHCTLIFFNYLSA